MNKVLRFCLFSFMVFSNFITFAQGDPGGEEDPQQAPIDGTLFLLAIVGVIFVIYTFNKNKKNI